MLDNLKNWCANFYPGVKIPGHVRDNFADVICMTWEAQRSLTTDMLHACCDFFGKIQLIDRVDEH